MSKQELKQKGFTIIEVVLVLAIAALIFLMVFIALPALQRSQRDTARKSDVGIVAGAVNSFQGNNRASAWPTSQQLQTYVTDVSGNTTKANVTVGATVAANNTAVTVADGSITVYPQGKCNTVAGTGAVTLDRGTTRQYATVTRLESGNNSGYCLDS
jgi:prepilin-type N-terminal cleavage/methylation domain-containing protein